MEDGEKSKNTLQHAAEGGAIGAAKNAARYAIENGGRKSNIVNVYDKTVISSRGNPKWFARIDKPHGNVQYHHVNVNKAITGVLDPHIPICQATAQAAGAAGQLMNVVNKVAPAVAAVSVVVETVQFGGAVFKDIQNGSTRNTLQKTVSTAAATAGGMSGFSAGAAIGTAVFPGVGTIVGGLFGAIFGGATAGACAEEASEKVFDSIGLGIDHPKCEKCGQEFERHRYKDGHQQFCPNCRRK